MVAAPGLWAVGRDVLWCLGLGLLLGAGRDVLGLGAGNGPIRCFLWDVAAFVLGAGALCGYAASASASGVTRWYMAVGMGSGALGWRWAVSPGLHRALGWGIGTLARLAARAQNAAVAPLRRVWAKLRPVKSSRPQRKTSQKVTKTKKVLQKGERILYN